MRICIVGAGPAGLLLAQHLMGNHNNNNNACYDVHVFDKLPNPLLTDSTDSRSYPIALQARGLNAIREVSPALTEKLVAKGQWMDTVRFDTTGKGGVQTMKRPAASLLMEQGDLKREMVQFLQEQQGQDAATTKSSLELHFDCDIQSIFLHNRTLLASCSKTKEQDAFVFDHLVAADGANSILREAFAQQDSKFHFDRKRVPGGYKPLFLERQAVTTTTTPTTGDKEESKSKPKEPAVLDSAIYGWMKGTQNFLSVPLPQKGYSSGVYAFTEDPDPLADCQTPADVLEYFQDKVPSLAQFLSEQEATQLLTRPTSTMCTVRCNRLTAGDNYEAILLGDAAHTFSAALNQGCNSALQDVQVLQKCLMKHNNNWNDALAAYEQERAQDVHAAHELSDYSLPQTKLQRVEFIGRMMLRKLPGLKRVIPPLPMDLIYREDLTYSDILQKCQGWIDKVKTTKSKRAEAAAKEATSIGEDQFTENVGKTKALLLK